MTKSESPNVDECCFVLLQVLPIYMHIRLLVSCYLFLTGFGHFTYFWRKGDYSLIQYCKVSSVSRGSLYMN